MSQYSYIRSRLPEDELLCQLAEEAAELAHAALKLRRVIVGINPTPVGEEEARAKLLEEIADVRLSETMLGLYARYADLMTLVDRKADRWEKRLREVEG